MPVKMMTDEELVEWAAKERYLSVARLGSDRIGFVVMTAVGQGQLGVTPLDDMTYVSDRYSFERFEEAVHALYAWVARDGEGEPNGWIRHQPSNRRRHGGDPETEWVAP